MQLPASLGAFPSFFVDQITLAPLAVRQNALLKSSGAEAHRDTLLTCKDCRCGSIFRKRQSTRVQMDADIFKNDFRQLQILVLCVFRIVGQQGLVGGRHGSHGVAYELSAQFRYSFTHAIVAGVVQVETLPQAQLLFWVLSDNINEQIASATKVLLGALQFFKGIAVHVQDNTSGTNVLGTFYQTTCVL